MGVAASIVNSSLDRETLVIGMDLMSGTHNAENIKAAIEVIVNRFKFDKRKIKGIIFKFNGLINYKSLDYFSYSL